MPFGLTNEPSTFQAVMNNLFRPMLRRYVLVFFDDILVYSKNWEHQMQHMQSVLELLHTQIFYANRNKCTFGDTTMDYLHHTISKQGVAMQYSKIQAILSWSTPHNVKGVRGFLGLTGYYPKFIQGYGCIAKPLTTLTKKDNFQWNQETQRAFEQLKQPLVIAPVLHLSYFTQLFTVECDASGSGIAAVLMQNLHPIAYFNEVLSDRNLAKSAYEREIMALALTVQHWRPYLLGSKFTVFTYQKSLGYLLHQRFTTPDQQHWVLKLLGFNFDINYKSSKENRAADALSRQEEGSYNSFLSSPTWEEGYHLVQEANQDPVLQKIKAALLHNSLSRPGFTLHNDILFHKGQLAISSNSKLIPHLIQEFHGSRTRGHSGYYRTNRRLATNLYQIGMSSTVQKFV